MRHGKKFNHLGRKTAHRKAMLANMACSLIEHKRINTTVAKAKALRQFIEPLITKSKAENNVTAEKGTHNRRIVFKNLRNKYAVTELFSSVAEKVGDRPGGYTRIIKLGNRLGDNADMAMIELVDFNELYNAGKPKKKSTRRSRRGGAKKEDSKVVEPAEEQASPAEAETTDSGSGLVDSEASPAQETAEAKKAEGDSAEAEAAETKANEAEVQETEAQETESQDAKADAGDSKASEDTDAAKSEKPAVEAEAEDAKAPEAKGDDAGEGAEPKKDDTK